MTYAGLKSMIYAGLSHEDPHVKAAWKWITHNWTLDENPGVKFGDAKNPKGGEDGLYYYYHTLARALHAYGQPSHHRRQGRQARLAAGIGGEAFLPANAGWALGRDTEVDGE